MKLSGRISLFLILSILITSCTNSPNELQKAESLIENKPDSALKILKNLSPNKYKSPENKALYGLVMIEALDRLKLPLPDSVLEFSLNYYRKTNESIRLANCYLYKGRIEKYKFHFDKAVTYLLIAEELAKNSPDYLLNGRIKFDLADIFRYQKEYDNAKLKYQQAYSCYTCAKSSSFALTTLISIGITYTYEKKYDIAHRYFYKVYHSTSDSMIKGLVMQNMGINYYCRKQYDSALYYLRKSIPYPYVKANKAIRMYHLADLYLDLQRYDSAFRYAQEAFKFNPDIVTKRECYRILVNSYNAKGDIPNLKQAMVEYQNCIDSLRKIETQPKGSYIENLHHTKAESKQNKLKLVIVIAVLFIFIILSCLLFRQLRRHSKKAIKQTEEKHIRRKAEIRKEHILMKSEALKGKIEKIKSEKIQEKRPVSITEREFQTRKIYENLLHLSDTEFFFDEMNSLFNNLVTKLKDRYPGLNNKELIWCCLYLLEVPTHDMLILLEYKTDNSLKRMKNRLSEKVSVENASLLGNLLFEIISED